MDHFDFLRSFEVAFDCQITKIVAALPITVTSIHWLACWNLRHCLGFLSPGPYQHVYN